MERTTGNLGDILLRDGLITNSQLEEAIRNHNQTGKPIGKALVDLGFISENDKLNTLKKRFGCEIISLSDVDIPPTILTYIPKSFASKHHLIPVRLDRDGLVVAMEDPTDIVTIDNLKTIVGIRIKASAAAGSEIAQIIEKMPDLAEPVIYVPGKKPLWFRILKYSAFPILCFIPIPVFILLVTHFNSFFNWLTKKDKFDILIYIVISWGFWAIILYWLNDIIFGEEQPKGKAKKEEDIF